MSNKSKGLWGENPSPRKPYQARPKYLRNTETADGCAGFFVIALIVLLTFAAVVANAQIIAENVIMQTWNF